MSSSRWVEEISPPSVPPDANPSARGGAANKAYTSVSRGAVEKPITSNHLSMKYPILAAAAALLVSAPISGRADVGVYEEERPTVERRVYTERRYVEPAPVYREEVRVYRP